jgi:hypothetical protein
MTAEEFNERYPVGMPCILKGKSKARLTKTTSAAFTHINGIDMVNVHVYARAPLSLLVPMTTPAELAKARIKQLFKNQSEFAEVIGFSIPHITRALKNNRIPDRWWAIFRERDNGEHYTIPGHQTIVARPQAIRRIHS